MSSRRLIDTVVLVVDPHATAREAQRLIGWARFNNGKGKQAAVEMLLSKADAALSSTRVPASGDRGVFDHLSRASLEAFYMTALQTITEFEDRAAEPKEAT